uniref:Uncharacterized protein n=1 Tax=Timema bartmani TaxID=61472 RepID=A0A7R9ENT3_9NEOP|nr:unnamed protein product [Timema bartmani]
MTPGHGNRTRDLWQKANYLVAMAALSDGSTPDRDSNLNLPIIGNLVYCKSSALDHAATEAADTLMDCGNVVGANLGWM